MRSLQNKATPLFSMRTGSQSDLTLSVNGTLQGKRAYQSIFEEVRAVVVDEFIVRGRRRFKRFRELIVQEGLW